MQSIIVSDGLGNPKPHALERGPRTPMQIIDGLDRSQLDRSLVYQHATQQLG